MSIRLAIASDAESIARVQVDSWREAYSDIIPADYLAGLSVSKRRVIWAESIRTDLPQILVAEDCGQVVGFSAMGPCRDDGSPSTAFEIWAIYLLPSHWSRGLGRELWLATRENLQKRGALRISLWVIANNERAIRFYRAAGFAPEARSLKLIELGGVKIKEIRYVHEVEI